MADPDPGSLDRLHDIAVPPPVSWWPPAPGWYVVAVVALVLLAIGAWALVARRYRNRYRREALRELELLTRGARAPVLAAIAELVKRVALAAYPRERVAALTGDVWLRFLDDTGRTDAFTRGAGRVLAEVAYRAEPGPPDPELVELVRHWIAHHRC